MVNIKRYKLKKMKIKWKTEKAIVMQAGYLLSTPRSESVTKNYRVVMDASGNMKQLNNYYPFGMAFANTPVAEQGKQPYKYNGKELDQMNGLNQYDYSARYYDPAITRFTTMNLMAEKYYSVSPYAYCANNPVRFVDLHGDSLTVFLNSNATYTIVGGTINTNLNIYLLDDTEKPSQVIGQQLTKYSYFDENGTVAKGAVIDPNDHSGENFLNNEIMNGNADLLSYMAKALPGGSLDFKKRGIDDGRLKNLSEEQYMHRGMPLNAVSGIQRGNGSVPIFGSARDVGNFAAGYIAGASGITWNAARNAFDGLESLQRTIPNHWPTRAIEGMPSQAAQMYGYAIGHQLFPLKKR
jgi:RHS repeat-associated protein